MRKLITAAALALVAGAPAAQAQQVTQTRTCSSYGQVCKQGCANRIRQVASCVMQC